MKVPVWMLFGLFVSILLMDLITLLVVRADLIAAVNMALDAALVGGLSEENLFKGQSFLVEHRAREAAADSWQKNLGLDHNGENRFLKKTELTLVFGEEQTKPVVGANVRATVTTMAPKLVGLEGIAVTVRKKQYFLQAYKNLAPEF